MQRGLRIDEHYNQDGDDLTLKQKVNGELNKTNNINMIPATSAQSKTPL